MRRCGYDPLAPAEFEASGVDETALRVPIQVLELSLELGRLPDVI